MAKKRIPPKDKRGPALKKGQRTGAKSLASVVVGRRARINDTIIKGVQGNNFLTSAIERDRLNREIEKQYIEFSGDVNKWSEKQSKKVARVWRNFAIADVGRSKYDQSWDQFDRKYLRDIIARVNPATTTKLVAINARLGGMLESDISFVRKQVSEVARLGASTGLTAKQKRLELIERVTKERPAWQFVDKSGRAWKSDNYFKMLNKTISNDVARDTYESVMSEAGLDLAVIEGGPSTVGDSCDDWVGRIYSVTGATEGYPTEAYITSVSHIYGPNCNHYPGAVDPSVQGELAKAKEEEAETREQVDRITEYREQAIAAGIPKSRAHKVIEAAAKDAKVSPFMLSKKDFDRELKIQVKKND